MPDSDATALVHQAMPLCATLGVCAERYTAGEVVLTLDWAPALCTTIVVETSVRDSTGRLVAKVTQTQMVLRART